jgi:hypothetical protein
LTAQAYALQAIFEKASLQIARSESLGALQGWAVLAMKAQGQCRQTLATIADIRNPKATAFIKQQKKPRLQSGELLTLLERNLIISLSQLDVK